MKVSIASLAAARGSDSAVASIDIGALLRELTLPIMDVRSPKEYRRGHIPGASSIPLFDDDERSEIGTLYKSVGRATAVNRGYEIVAPKIDDLVDRTRAAVSGSEFFVHCWRGGMRSEGFAQACKQSGLKPRRLEGGYKSFRRAALRCFEEPRQLIVLGGQSGSGKTKLLELLREAGEQVIDLEDLAHHRGSVFGGLGMSQQPTVEQFENELFLRWHAADPDRPLWIEGESRGIGKVIVPQSVWTQMSTSPVVLVEVALDDRIEFLLGQYGDLPKDELAAAIQRLRKRLGGLRLQLALDALERDDLSEFTRLALEYYDKSYSKALERFWSKTVVNLPMATAGDADAITTLIDLGQELTGRRRV